MSSTAGVLSEAGTTYHWRALWLHPRFFSGVSVAHQFSISYCPFMCRYVL